jgi:hypothetical protein
VETAPGNPGDGLRAASKCRQQNRAQQAELNQIMFCFHNEFSGYIIVAMDSG